MIDPDKYFIYWRALATGATGHGSGQFPKEQAERIAAEMNEANKGLLFHWILPGSAMIQIVRGIAAKEHTQE